MDGLLRALHPFMPFITEEIWLKLAPLTGNADPTIMNQPYPTLDDYQAAPADETVCAWLKEFVLGVRRIRAEYDIEPSARLPVFSREGSADEQRWLATHHRIVEQLARTQAIGPAPDAPGDVATALAGGMTVLVPLSDLIDKDAELARVSKELERLEGEISRAQAKLGNASFVERAPAAVVNKERERLAEATSAAETLRVQVARLRA